MASEASSKIERAAYEISECNSSYSQIYGLVSELRSHETDIRDIADKY